MALISPGCHAGCEEPRPARSGPSSQSGRIVRTVSTTAFQIGAKNDVGSDVSSSTAGLTSAAAGVGIAPAWTPGVGVGLFSGVGVAATGLTRW